MADNTRTPDRLWTSISCRPLLSLVAVCTAMVVAAAGCGKKSDTSPWTTQAKGDNSLPAHCIPPQVLVVLDKSSSMSRNKIGGKTLWEISYEALGTVLSTYETKIDFGLMLFPQPDKCQVGAINVQPAASNAQAILAQLIAAPPLSGNYTPMAQTLDMVSTLDWIAAGNTHVLFITDGWQWCGDDAAENTAMAKAAVNAVEKLRNLGVTTHVVGFGGSVDTLTLNRMAARGGNKRGPTCNENSTSPASSNNCYYQANDPSQLLAALQDISAKIDTEICNGIDDNCNGLIDEGVEDQATLCAKQLGVCAGAKSVCDSVVAKGWICTDEVYAAHAMANGQVYEAGEETLCDGLDNNCDGRIDENCECRPTDPPRACGSDVGECAKQRGTQTCIDGKWSECVGAMEPQPEVCDGLDNNCDGQIDEIGCACLVGQAEPCGSNVGECRQGTRTCGPTGQWGECVGSVPPSPEVCDGKDNDCNGQIDDGLEGPKCDKQAGVCSGAVASCGGASGWKPCGEAEYQASALLHGSIYQADETLCDNFDNDCDGTIDEGCDCMDGQVRSCGQEQGVCEPGQQVCMGGKWGPCNGGVQPSAEVCDGKDNNCNGQVDENLTRPCSGQCGPGTQTCENGVWGPCSAREPSIEVCDGVDNDCDGVIDGPNALCDNGGVCINGRCTPPETRLDYGVMAGGGITCQIDGNGRPALPLSLLALLGLLLVRRRRPG